MANSSKIQSILFVCMGNICRSPTGENVMRKRLEAAGLQDTVRCDSAGTINYHTGNPPDARMTAAARKRGYNMVGSARQVTAQDLEDFDLILAMDTVNYADLLKLSNKENHDKIKMFCQYCAQHSDTQVPDPYYGGEEGFEYVLDLIEDGCDQILKQLKSQN